MFGGALTALQAEEFAQLMEGFAPWADRLALAVSGGSDSMALAVCIRRWARRPFIAFIVDHGLRAESTQESTEAAARLSRMGIESEILRWDHDTITTRRHEKARAARYALLREACTRHNARDLLLAHHRDDQAETILMRLAKGSGSEGLSGMRRESSWDGIRLLRPFLSVPKTRLMATCHAADAPFVQDPSNDSTHTARGRLRRVMPLLEAEGFTGARLTVLGARAAEDSDALNFYTHAFLRTAQVGCGGEIRWDIGTFLDLPRAVAGRVLSSALRFVHDTGYPPRHEALAGVLDSLSSETVRCLNGCLIVRGKKGFTLLREPEAVREILPIKGGETTFWDQRWRVTIRDDVPADTEIRALGAPPHALLDRLAPLLRRQIPQGRIRATLPALWHGDSLQAIPSFDEKEPLSLRPRQKFQVKIL